MWLPKQFLWETGRIAFYLWTVREAWNHLLWPTEFLTRIQILVELIVFCDPGNSRVAASRIVMNVPVRKWKSRFARVSFHYSLSVNIFSDRFFLVWTNQDLLYSDFLFHRYRPVHGNSAYFTPPLSCWKFYILDIHAFPGRREWTKWLP